MTPKTLLDGLVFPECPRWHDGALYFSDMHDGIVWRLSQEGQASKVLELATSPGGLGWLPDGTLQVVSMLDRHLLRLTPEGLVTIADLSSFAAHPINDMVVDHEGRAYIGNFGFDVGQGEAPRPTVLLCVEATGGVRVVAEDLLFPNGAVITPDGRFSSLRKHLVRALPPLTFRGMAGLQTAGRSQSSRDSTLTESAWMRRALSGLPARSATRLFGSTRAVRSLKMSHCLGATLSPACSRCRPPQSLHLYCPAIRAAVHQAIARWQN
jgi:hypothetical protein